MKRTAPPRRIAPLEPRLLESVELGAHQDNGALLEHLEEVAVAAARERGLSEEDAHYLGVAIREAATNGIVHGCRRAGASVLVRVGLSCEGALFATVTDQGPGFDPAAVPDPLVPRNAERGSGRGLFFMRRFADRVSFSFPRCGGAVVRIEKDLPRR
jgi:serine/threonine-protein kinase RsbW